MFVRSLIVTLITLLCTALLWANDGPMLIDEDLVPAVTEPAHVDELVTIAADKVTSENHLALFAQAMKTEITAEEREQATAQLLANDRLIITTWAHSLKFASGREFTREVTPSNIVDKRMVAIFPEMQFYSVALPGYFGGAAPTERILRSFDVPSILLRQNIFVVNKTGGIKLITGLQSRTQFFQQFLPPVLSEGVVRNAAACWLLLAKQYISQFNQRPEFFIDESKFPVTELHGDVMNLEVNGLAIADPETNITGEITVKMRFAFDGKLQFADEKQQIECGMIFMPPAAPPPGNPPMPLAVE